MEENLVSLTLSSYSLLLLSTSATSHAVGFKSETQFLVPMLLFFGKKDEWPATITTVMRLVAGARQSRLGRFCRLMVSARRNHV